MDQLDHQILWPGSFESDLSASAFEYRFELDPADQQLLESASWNLDTSDFWNDAQLSASLTTLSNQVGDQNGGRTSDNPTTANELSVGSTVTTPAPHSRRPADMNEVLSARIDALEKQLASQSLRIDKALDWASQMESWSKQVSSLIKSLTHSVKDKAKR